MLLIQARCLILLFLALVSCRTTPSQVASEPSAVSSQSATRDYFCDTDVACRDNFLKALGERSDATHWRVDLPKESQDDGENLGIDFVYFGKPDQRNLVILTSGIHGAEGLVGSALQHMFVREQLDAVLAAGSNVLIMHGINAYGFRHKSRFAKDRVDLNRNWFVPDVFPGGQFDITFYKKYEKLLNPQKKASYGKVDFAGFITTSILPYIRSAANGNVTRAAGEGQYQIPDAISFGGKDYEPNYHIVKDVLKKYLPQNEHILMVDLHTGLGKRQLQLLPNPPYNAAVGERRKQIFNTAGHQIEETGGATFYESHGDFSDFVCQFAETLPTTKHCTNMLLEFGSLLKSDFEQATLTSGLKNYSNLIYTLYITTRENQMAHFGPSSPEEGEKIKQHWQDMFYPGEKEWRDMVLRESRQLLPVYFANFSTLSKKSP